MPLLKPSTPPKKSTKPAAKILPPKKKESLAWQICVKGKAAPTASAARAFILGSTLPRAQTRRGRHWTCIYWHHHYFGLALHQSLRPHWQGNFFHYHKFLAGVFYILPLGLLVFGLWLVFRKIERIPPLSAERVVGSVILFLWLLTVLHSLVATSGNR